MTLAPGVVFSHVALNCGDQAKTEDFYRRHLGFERVRTVEAGEHQVLFLRNGSVLLELFDAEGARLFDPMKDGPANPGVIRHLAFQTDDVDAFIAGIGDEVPVSLGPISFDDFIPGWRTVWVLDPDGVIVEVSQGYHDQDDRRNG
ncbi:MAG TPA: VOC family protein [Pseudonocardiaceae bacterium]|nr:VOC family protein [Pseudonocardiaceae bacterium]